MYIYIYIKRVAYYNTLNLSGFETPKNLDIVRIISFASYRYDAKFGFICKLSMQMPRRVEHEAA